MLKLSEFGLGVIVAGFLVSICAGQQDGSCPVCMTTFSGIVQEKIQLFC